MASTGDSPSIIDLFHAELESHALTLEKGLAECGASASGGRIEPLMRAAHSLKGAARIVGLNNAVQLTQAMEELLNSGLRGSRTLDAPVLDHLRAATRFLRQLAAGDASGIEETLAGASGEIDELVKRLKSLPGETEKAGRKRVLVADDSLTVREVERRLLENRGYEVTVAVDGIDAWNIVQGKHFNLVVANVDMPRMDGIDLVKRIKSSAATSSIPVMIVSYKDQNEDRTRGLEAGASYYLPISSFHDETIIDAVRDLIGDAD